MAIPNINQNDILEALKYIDENGVPLHNQRTRYELVREDGKNIHPNMSLPSQIIWRMAETSQQRLFMEQKRENFCRSTDSALR